jgi:hypothetical protein
MALQRAQEAPAGVEYRPPEAGAQVRILPGAPPKAQVMGLMLPARRLIKWILTTLYPHSCVPTSVAGAPAGYSLPGGDHWRAYAVSRRQRALEAKLG